MNQQRIERGEVLTQIDSALAKGKCLVFGERGCGKSTLAKILAQRHKERHVALIDAKHIALTPEQFAIDFISHVLYAMPSTLDALLQSKGQIGDDAFFCITSINNELLKIKPNQHTLVESALSFPARYAKFSKKKILVIIDNCEELLELNHFAQITNVLALIEPSAQVSYALFSSESSEIRGQCKEWPYVDIAPFSLDELNRMLHIKHPHLSAKSRIDIAQASLSSPFVTSQIAHGFLDGHDPRHALAKNLLDDQSALSLHCQLLLEVTLSSARGRTLPLAVLRSLSKKEQRLTELSKSIHRSAPITKSVVERLAACGAIEKKGKLLAIRSKLLSAYLRMQQAVTSDDDITNAVRLL